MWANCCRYTCSTWYAWNFLNFRRQREKREKVCVCDVRNCMQYVSTMCYDWNSMNVRRQRVVCLNFKRQRERRERVCACDASNCSMHWNSVNVRRQREGRETVCVCDVWNCWQCVSTMWCDWNSINVRRQRMKREVIMKPLWISGERGREERQCLCLWCKQLLTVCIFGVLRLQLNERLKTEKEKWENVRAWRNCFNLVWLKVNLW